MDTLAVVVVPFAVALVVGMLFRSASQRKTLSDARSAVEYGWGFKGLAVLQGMVTAAPLIGMAFAPPDQRLSLLLISLVFGLPALYLILEGFGVRVVYSERGIEACSPWRKRRFVPWEAIRCVSYSPGARWYRIETQDSGFIRLHEMKSGVPGLLHELRRRGVSGA